MDVSNEDVLEFIQFDLTNVDNGTTYERGWYTDGDFCEDMHNKLSGIEKKQILAKKVLHLVNEALKHKPHDENAKNSILLRSCMVADVIGTKCNSLASDAVSILDKVETMVNEDIENRDDVEFTTQADCDRESILDFIKTIKCYINKSQYEHEKKPVELTKKQAQEIENALNRNQRLSPPKGTKPSNRNPKGGRR